MSAAVIADGIADSFRYGGKIGDEIVYLSLAGYRCDAAVNMVRPDGRLDLAVDAGSKDPVMLTRIAFVEPADLRPGTCSVGRRA